MSVDSHSRPGRPENLNGVSGSESTEAESTTRSVQGYAPFSKRAYIIGLILCPLIVFWAEYNEVVAQGADLIAMSLIMSVVFVLMVLMVVNGLLRRFAPAMALSQAEMMLIYTINSASVGICGIGMMQFLVPQLTGPVQYASSTNGWVRWMYLLKSWAFPDKSVIPDYYAGHTTFFTHAHVMGWVTPIIVWSCFLFVLLYCMYCIGTLLRRQWMESERLIFPIAVVPLELTNDTPTEGPVLWKNRLFWGGFAIAFLLEALASLHYTVNAKIPYVPLKPNEPMFNVGQGMTSPPWTAINNTEIGFYPLVIGLIYLLSLDVSFSCWFFYLMTKAQTLTAVMFGARDAHDAWSTTTAVPYTGQQGVGAFVALAGMALFGSWPHLKRAFKAAFSPKDGGTVTDVDEPISYRTAYVGLAVSFVLLVAFGVALGVAWYVGAFFFALFMVYVIALTRIRAEAGLPWSVGPVPYTAGTMVDIAGSHSFSTPSLVGLSMFRWFDADWRSPQMPNYMEAMKISQSARINPRHLTFAIGSGTVVATIASWVSLLAIYYTFGASSSHVNSWRTDQAHYGFDTLNGWLQTPHGFDATGFKWTIAGACVVLLLSIMRRNFVWWPFHPIGYAVANAGSGAPFEWVWMSIFVGWLCKYLTLRYGGIQAFRKLMPFFIGLILGDYAAGAISSLIFLFNHMDGYRTFPI